MKVELSICVIYIVLVILYLFQEKLQLFQAENVQSSCTIFTSVQYLTNHDCFILLDFIVLPLMKFNAQLLCEDDELNNFCLPTINFYIITGFSSRRLHF